MSARRDRRQEISNATTLLRRRKPGRSLEAPFYLDDGLFNLDLDLIFSRHWIHVGVEADVPAPGDYVTIAFGRYSLIIVRGADMRIRGFHNVCSRPGALGVHEPKGKVQRIVGA